MLQQCSYVSTCTRWFYTTKNNLENIKYIKYLVSIKISCFYTDKLKISWERLKNQWVFSHVCVFNQRILHEDSIMGDFWDEKWHNQLNFLLKSKQLKPKIFFTIGHRCILARDQLKSILSLVKRHHFYCSRTHFMTVCVTVCTTRQQDGSVILWFLIIFYDQNHVWPAFTK